MDARFRNVEQRARSGDLEAYPALAAHFERAGFPVHAYLLSWWAQRRGVRCGEGWRALGRSLTDRQRPALERLAHEDPRLRVAFRPEEGEEPWSLTWEWRTVSRLNGKEPPILALLGSLGGAGRAAQVADVGTLMDLRVCHPPKQAEGWRPLRGLPCLTRLDVDARCMKRRSLAAAVTGISGLTPLRALALADVRADAVTPDGCAAVAGLPRLRTLSIVVFDLGRPPSWRADMKTLRERLGSVELLFRYPPGHCSVTMRAYGFA